MFISDKLFKSMCELLAEISRREHEDFEPEVCEEFINENGLAEFIDEV